MVSGDLNIVIEENGEVKTILVRSLYYKLMGKTRAFKKTVDRISQIIDVKSNIKIQCLDGDKVGFTSVKNALCGFAEVFKLRGDRIALTATSDTEIFNKKHGLMQLSKVYSKDMIQYINQKGLVVFDWVIDLELQEKCFVYDFITENSNFICNRVVIGNAK